jgi:hypothetical protein
VTSLERVTCKDFKRSFVPAGEVTVVCNQCESKILNIYFSGEYRPTKFKDYFQSFAKRYNVLLHDDFNMWPV